MKLRPREKMEMYDVDICRYVVKLIGGDMKQLVESCRYPQLLALRQVWCPSFLYQNKVTSLCFIHWHPTSRPLKAHRGQGVWKTITELLGQGACLDTSFLTFRLARASPWRHWTKPWSHLVWAVFYVIWRSCSVLQTVNSCKQFFGQRCTWRLLNQIYQYSQYIVSTYVP